VPFGGLVAKPRSDSRLGSGMAPDWESHGSLLPFVLLAAAVHLAVLAVWQPRMISSPELGNPLAIELVSYHEDAAGIGKRAPRATPHASTPEQNHASTTGSKVAPKMITKHRPKSASTVADRETRITQRRTDSAKPTRHARSPRMAATRKPPVRVENPSTSKTVQVIEAAKLEAADPVQEDTSTVRDTKTWLQQALRRSLVARFFYPGIARRKGWQGQVKVQLRVEADGHLTNVRVLQTSGHAILDRAAVDTIREISLIPEAGGWLRGRHFDMVLPVQYVLVGG
jgi:protein TonB